MQIFHEKEGEDITVLHNKIMNIWNAPQFNKKNCHQENTIPVGSLIALDSVEQIRSTCCLNDNLSISGRSKSSKLW